MQHLDFEKPVAELEAELGKLQKKSQKQGIDMTSEIVTMEEKLSNTRKRIYAELTSWQRIQISKTVITILL